MSDADSTRFTMPVISNAAGLKSCSAFANAKENFQRTGITWIFQQTLLGNFDALNLAFERAGLLLPRGEVSSDGKAVWKYLTGDIEDGGLGLKEIIRWDKESGKFRAKKGWRANADLLNLEQAEHNLQAVLWYTFGKNTEKAERAFNLDARVLRLVKDCKKQKLSDVEIAAAVTKALKAVAA